MTSTKQKYRVKVYVYDDETDQNDEMTVRSELSGSDLKHLIKRQVGELLSFEKMNPNNTAIH